MKFLHKYLLALLMLMGIYSCGGGVYVSQINSSPYKNAIVFIKVTGIPFHGYDEKTKKEISVLVRLPRSDQEIILAEVHRSLIASAINWNVIWHSENRFSVDFYDYPEGYTEYSKEVRQGVIKRNFIYRLTLSRASENSLFKLEE